MGAKWKRWHLDTIVFGSLSASVVAKTKYTFGGGSSRLFSRALNASWVSM